MASPDFETHGNDSEQGHPNMSAGEGKTSLPDLSKRVIKVLVSFVVSLKSMMKMWVAGIGIFLVGSGIK